MSSQEVAAAAPPAEMNEIRLSDAVKSAKEQKEKKGDAPTGCLPKFTSPRILSPGYFSRMTPRTRTALGDENFSAQLMEMRAKFPNQPDHDMVPFLRIHNVRLYNNLTGGLTGREGSGGEGAEEEQGRGAACWRVERLGVADTLHAGIVRMFLSGDNRATCRRPRRCTRRAWRGVRRTCRSRRRAASRR